MAITLCADLILDVCGSGGDDGSCFCCRFGGEEDCYVKSMHIHNHSQVDIQFRFGGNNVVTKLVMEIAMVTKT